MSFVSLGLSLPLQQAAAARNYTEPTPVQAAAIPAVLAGRDMRAAAETGSGKTAAFALPLLQRLHERRSGGGHRVRTLVLVPTRELAAQIGDSFRAYGDFLPEQLRVSVVYGGVSINAQMLALRGGSDILIATPGRLLDLVERKAVSLDQVASLVLDEADRLFALGFADELARVLALLPEKRQNLLFSATFPTEVNALAEALLHDPVRIELVPAAAAPAAIVQRAIEVDQIRRTQLLRHLIQEEKWTRALVFVATTYATEHVAEKLRKAGINAEAFHGEMGQSTRTQRLADFKEGKIQILIATDVASRGIDIALLPVVVNYDLPRSPTDYTHRIGRTGRAGESGIAVSFVSVSTDAHFRLIEKRCHVRVPREQIAGFEPVELDVPEKPAGTGGIKGKRPNKKEKLRMAEAAEAQRKAAGLPPARPAASHAWHRRPAGGRQRF